MIRVLLCDDNKDAIIHYSAAIQQIADRNNIVVTVSSFNNGEEVLFHLKKQPEQIDIIFMDVLMKSINGVDTAKELRKSGCEAEIIFLTESKDYVYEAFDVTPVQYLLKDTLTETHLESVFLKAVELSQKKSTAMLAYVTGGVKKIVPLRSISYFEIWKRVIMIHFENGETDKFYGQLDPLEKQLTDKDFIRVHRSYLVNLQHVAQFKSQRIALKNGLTVPIGGAYTNETQASFLDYISRTNIILID